MLAGPPLRVRFFNGTVFVASLFLVGCASQSHPGRNTIPPIWQRDTPEVRKLQKQETEKYFPQAVARKRLKETVGACVEVIHNAPDNPESGIGRAVAITSDGYYLTAYHVVDGAAFFLVDGLIKPRPKPGSAQTADINPVSKADAKPYAGRLVWSDPDLDLAILKFDRPAACYFEKMRRHVKADDLVYTADDGGWAIYPGTGKPDEIIKLSDVLDGMVGNGSFFSAGKVVDSKQGSAGAKSALHCLTLIARGGMSGAPLVTMDNELCGIIVRGSVGPRLFGWPPSLSRAPRTYATMIEPDFILEKVRADRAGSIGRTRPVGSDR